MAASSKSKGSSPGSKAKGETKPKARSRAKSKTSPDNQQPKKRRRTSTKKTEEATAKAETPSPTHTLVVDNGGDTLKYGWVNDTIEEPSRLPNVTARLKHQLTILVGDELREKVPNPNQMYSITRSTERGVVTNLGNQVQVWKRMLDLLGVILPNMDSEAAQAFGWKVARANKAAKQQQQQQQQQESANTPKIPAGFVAVLLLVPPHCPRSVLDQMMYVWMEDFGVNHVGFGTSQICATQPDPELQTGCLVDLGWSAIHIVPTFRGKHITNPDQEEGRSKCAIRRMPLGGRHLVNMWKYYASYRQWNLMDQEWILRDVFEKLAYVSLDFAKELEEARRKQQGRRSFDRNFVLPDYQTTYQGHVDLPPALKREAEALEKQKQEEEEEAEDEDDEDFEDTKMEEDVELEGAVEEEHDDNQDEDGNGSDKDADDNAEDEDDADKKEDDSEDDSEDEDNNKDLMRQRLLRQKQEEERRRKEMEAEQQVLAVSVERFTVPEVLFHPSDAGLPIGMAGLAHSIVQSIKTCPRYLQPALFRSIQVTGGVSQLPNILERLQRELRALVPSEYEVKISKVEKPVEQAWLGAREWTRKKSYTQWSVSRSDWEKSQKRKAWTKFLVANDGVLV